MSQQITNTEKSRLRRTAKKMGANDIQLGCIDYTVWFGRTSVSFAFKPLKYYTSILPAGYCIPPVSDFSTEADVKRIAEDMRKSLSFIEYLKEFEQTLT